MEIYKKYVHNQHNLFGIMIYLILILLCILKVNL